MTGHDGEHQGAESELGRYVQVGAMGKQQFDDFAMARMCGEHEGRLAEAVARIDIHALCEKCARCLRISARHRFFPGGIHYPSTFNNSFVANTINITANSLRSTSTFMRCAAFAPKGAVSTLANAIQNSAGR